MSQIEFKGEASMKSGCRFTERGVEIYDEAKGEWEPIASACEWVNKRTRPAKPNNKTMDYRVKTELLYHYDLGDEIEKYERDKLVIGEGCPESWFEPVEEMQEGDWIYSGYIDRCFRVVKGKDMSGANRVIFPDDMGNKEFTTTFDLSKSGYREATTDEIEQALIKEAKRRGLVPGNKVKTPCGFEYTLSGNPYEYKYRDDLDRLYSSGVLIYDNGDFAEIVDQTPTIEINGHKVEFNEDPKVECVTINKDKFITQAYFISQYGVRVHRKGEDITDQILAIASHYGYGDEIKYRAGDAMITGTLKGVTFSDQNMWGNND